MAGEGGGRAQIRIEDAEGNLVRELTGPAVPGINRTYWDLRHPAPSLPRFRTKPPGRDWVPLEQGEDRVVYVWDIDLIRGDTSRIHSVGEISFDWTAGTNDAPTFHGLMSRNTAGNLSDSVSLNSFDDIILRLDSNNNNGTSIFHVKDGTTTGSGTANDLFRVTLAWPISPPGFGAAPRRIEPPSSTCTPVDVDGTAGFCASAERATTN